MLTLIIKYILNELIKRSALFCRVMNHVNRTKKDGLQIQYTPNNTNTTVH